MGAVATISAISLKPLKSRTSNEMESCAGPSQSYPVRGESLVLPVSELLSKNIQQHMLQPGPSQAKNGPGHLRD